MKESDLDLAFAEHLVASERFRRWLLERTGLAGPLEQMRLLDDEQATARPQVARKFWYRYWWTQLDDRSQSETDIFVLFERVSDGQRFALHIENKLSNGKFTFNQPDQYAKRAQFMATNGKIKYSEWRTVLLAPQAFYSANPACTTFDLFIPHEEIADFVPQFRQSTSVDRRSNRLTTRNVDPNAPADLQDFDADPVFSDSSDPEFRREMFRFFRERGWQPKDLIDREIAEEYAEWLSATSDQQNVEPNA